MTLRRGRLCVEPGLHTVAAKAWAGRLRLLLEGRRRLGKVGLALPLAGGEVGLLLRLLVLVLRQRGQRRGRVEGVVELRWRAKAACSTWAPTLRRNETVQQLFHQHEQI